MATVDRSNQYLKLIKASDKTVFAGDKGANSVTASLPAGDYKAGDIKAFYDATAGTTVGDTASDQVDVPAFTIPAKLAAPADIKVAATADGATITAD